MRTATVVKWTALAAMTALATTGQASARKAPDGPPPAQITSLLACRAITGEAERLACFDKAAAAIDTAVTSKDIVVFDREGVKRTKKGLFGFGIPNLGIFGDDDDSVEIKQVEGVIAGLGRTVDGFIFKLEDGSRWVQTDGKPIFIDPRIGDKVVIKKGALTSYIMSVNKQPGVKVKRTE